MAQDTDTGKKRGGPWRVVFVLALIVFIASIAALGVVAFSYIQGQMKYNAIAEQSSFEPDDLTGKELKDASVDWGALLVVNGDTVGWIYMPNTVINYPVVQGPDNDYYLNHDFEGAQGWLANYGTVFLDYRNKPDWTDQVNFVYGHHMHDGTMFSDLAGLDDQARFDECRTVYLLSPSGNFKLRTFALVHVPADAEIVLTGFSDPQEMTAYVQDKINRSVVEPGPIPAASEIKRVFALATCDNLSADGRYVLYAYIENTSAEGLKGTLGVETGEGQAGEIVNDLIVEEKK